MTKTDDLLGDLLKKIVQFLPLIASHDNQQCRFSAVFIKLTAELLIIVVAFKVLVFLLLSNLCLFLMYNSENPFSG